MTIKAEYPIGKTQWAKWNDDARAAFNKMQALGFTFETAVAEANAKQALAGTAPAPEEPITPAPEEPVASAPAPAPKPRAPRVRKDK